MTRRPNIRGGEEIPRVIKRHNKESSRTETPFTTNCWEQEQNFTYSDAEFCFPLGDIAYTTLSYYLLYGNFTWQNQPLTSIHDNDGVTGSHQNACLNGWENPTGYCDAIGFLMHGSLIGWDWANNFNIGTGMMARMTRAEHWIVNGVGNEPPFPTGSFPITDQQTFDDLVLYKASTGNWYALDEQSHNLLFNQTQWFNNIHVGSGEYTDVPYGCTYNDYPNYSNCLILGVPPIHIDNMPHNCNYDEGDCSMNYNINFQEEYTSDEVLMGDINQDLQINIQDVVIMINMILTEIPGETIAQQYPQADMDGNGIVNVLDVVTLIQTILGNPRTSSRDRQELQRQLNRLK